MDHTEEWFALSAVARRLKIQVADDMPASEISERIARHDRTTRPSGELRRYWNDKIRQAQNSLGPLPKH